MMRDTAGRGQIDTPLSTIIGNLVGNMQDLVRGEIKLARHEVMEEVRAAGMGAGMLVGAAIFGLVALIFLGLTATHGLTRLVPDWAAAGIVTVLFLVVAGVLFSIGKRRLQAVNLVPQQTIKSLKEDTEWVKEQLTADR
jgi:uncharacterized membrane protein YqjE